MEKNMSLDGKFALNDVLFNKSDLHHIPLVDHSAIRGSLSGRKLMGRRPRSLT
jgi:hypothetical protein